jgi:hypothetical protein
MLRVIASAILVLLTCFAANGDLLLDPTRSDPELKPFQTLPNQSAAGKKKSVTFEIPWPPALEFSPALKAPEDPCLPPLFKDWSEYAAYEKGVGYGNNGIRYRIVIDKTNFDLRFEAIGKNDSATLVYDTHVALGDIHTPTPEGNFWINHVYCYPDVMYFAAESAEPIPGLYNGFMAPILVCDSNGKCRRYRDLGLHGYKSTPLTRTVSSRPGTFGAISAGCIRVPDPCRLKAAIIKHVGIGPLKRNDRGSYHWLNKPVEVIIASSYPEIAENTNFASAVQQGLEQVHDGIKNIFDIFGR